MQGHAATVDQQQRVAGAQIAQVDRSDIAAGVVDSGFILFVESDCSGLRDGTEQLVARSCTGVFDRLFVEHCHGKYVVDLGAPDLATDDDDSIRIARFDLRRGIYGLRFLFGLRGILCGGTRSRCGSENACAAQQRKPCVSLGIHGLSPSLQICSVVRLVCQASKMSGHWLRICCGLPSPQPWPPCSKMCNSAGAPLATSDWNRAIP